MKKINKLKEVDVFLYGQRVGILLDDNGRIFFQYSTKFKGLGIEISPLVMPLNGKMPYFNNEHFEVYKGMGAIFYDSLPDVAGEKFVKKYFESKGILYNNVSILDKLLFIGDRGMGALEYEPKYKNDEIFLDYDIDIDDIKNSYDQTLDSLEFRDINDAMALIINSASPVGGARPKSLVNYNVEKNKIMYHRSDLKDGYGRYIVKFDEFFNDNFSRNITKMESLYNSLARECGINVAESLLVKSNTGVHYLTKRFDRDINDNKFHMATASSLLNKPLMYESVSYEDLLRLTNLLTQNQDDVEEMFRRIVFNIVGFNNDAHAKNHSFLMDRDGKWRLSPAYDLLYTKGLGVMKSIMTINGKGKDIGYDDFLGLGDKYMVKKSFVDDVIRKTIDVFSSFEQKAKAFGINKRNYENALFDINGYIDFLKRQVISYCVRPIEECLSDIEEMDKKTKASVKPKL